MARGLYATDRLEVLDNGLQVVAVELPHMRAGFATVMVRGGPRYETERTHGLSHFCEHMLFRGCGRWTSTRELAVAAERFFGSLDGATYRDHVVYSTAFEPAKVNDATALLGEMMRRPRFEGLAIEKKVLLEEISECFDENGREIEIDNISRALIFPRHPAGQSIDGTPDTLRRFTLRGLRAHHEAFYGAANMVIAVAGPMGHKQVFDAVRRGFSALRQGQRVQGRLGPPTAKRGPSLRIVRHPGSQTQLRLVYNAFGYHDARMQALQLVRRVLDDGFTTRFQAELVDRKGLAYELWADADLFDDCGVLEFGASVTHGKEAMAVRALLEEAKRLSRDGPTSLELRRARERYRWALSQMHDSSAAVSEWHARGLLLGVERRPAKLLTDIAKLGPSDVKRVARAVFAPESLAVAVVGDMPRRQASALRKLLRGWRV